MNIMQTPFTEPMVMLDSVILVAAVRLIIAIAVTAEVLVDVLVLGCISSIILNMSGKMGSKISTQYFWCIKGVIYNILKCIIIYMYIIQLNFQIL